MVPEQSSSSQSGGDCAVIALQESFSNDESSAPAPSAFTSLSAPSDEGGDTKDTSRPGTAANTSAKIPTAIATVDIYRPNPPIPIEPEARTAREAQAPTFDARKFQRLAKARHTNLLQAKLQGADESPPGFKLRISEEDRIALEYPPRQLDNLKQIARTKRASSSSPEPESRPVADSNVNPKRPQMMSITDGIYSQKLHAENDDHPALADIMDSEDEDHPTRNAPTDQTKSLDLRRWRELQVKLVNERPMDFSERRAASASTIASNADGMMLRKHATPAALKALAKLAENVGSQMHSDPFILRAPSARLRVGPDLKLRKETMRPRMRSDSYDNHDDISAVTSIFPSAKLDSRLDRMASLTSSTLSSWELLSLDEAHEEQKQTTFLTRFAWVLKRTLRRVGQLLVMLLVVRTCWAFFHRTGCFKQRRMSFENIRPSFEKLKIQIYPNQEAFGIHHTVTNAKRALSQASWSLIPIPGHPIRSMMMIPSRLYAGLTDSLLALFMRVAQLGSRSVSYIFQHHIHLLETHNSMERTPRMKRRTEHRTRQNEKRRSIPRPTKEATMSWKPQIVEPECPATKMDQELPVDEVSCPIESNPQVSATSPLLQNSATDTNEPQASDSAAPVEVEYITEAQPRNNVPGTMETKPKPTNKESQRNPQFEGNFPAGRTLFIELDAFDTCYRPLIDMDFGSMDYLRENGSDDDVQKFDPIEFIRGVWEQLQENFLNKLDDDLSLLV